jgi:hypothetical protein
MFVRTSLLTSKRLGLAVALVTLLASVYMISYSGRIESGDTLSLFDATGSLIRYGDNYYDRSAFYNPPPPERDDSLYPLKTSTVEPLQRILAGTLYSLADKLQHVGYVHVVWLLNIIVTASAGGIFFLYVLALGYDERVGIFAGLILGCTTILWPYSKTFFREPLALLLILLAGLFIERWRATAYRSIPLLVGMILALVGALLTKEAVIFALPTFIIIGLPAIQITPFLRRSFIFIIVIIVLIASTFIVLMSLAGTIQLDFVYVPAARLFHVDPPDVEHYLITTRIALHSYLLSVGGSVWGTSPFLLLAVPGSWMLYRQQKYRYVIVAPLILLIFAFGYATLRGVHWFGGLSWPPRFLIPVVPYVLLGAIPVLNRILHKPVRRWAVVCVGSLIIYSLWVQFSAITLPWGAYTTALPPEANGLGEWGGGLNVVQYLRWVIIPSLWSSQPLDFAWSRVNTFLWPALFVLLILINSVIIISLVRSQRRFISRIAFTLPAVFVLAAWMGLRLIYNDPLYQPPVRDALFKMMQTAATQSKAGDILLLDGDDYSSFFLNYGTIKWPRIIALPAQPGEQFSPEQTPEVRSDNPDRLLLKDTIPLIYNLAGTRSHLWLLASSGPFISWRVRPIERFMAAHYFPIQEITFDPAVRLIEYSTVNAPLPFTFRGPDQLSGLLYGEGMRLAGYSLPSGITYKRGDILPLSLYWQAEQKLQRDYIIAWFLTPEGQNPAAQGMDSEPGGGFAHTSQWLLNAPVWDNRAMHLPPDLKPGVYRLWVRVYYWDAGNLHLLPVSGGQTADVNTGILPALITIQAS